MEATLNDPLAQVVERGADNTEVTGSRPVWIISLSYIASIAQLGERKTEVLEVPRSIRGGSIYFGQRVRVVKETDLKSVGLCPRRFKSCRCRFHSLYIC